MPNAGGIGASEAHTGGLRPICMPNAGGIGASEAHTGGGAGGEEGGSTLQSQARENAWYRIFGYGASSRFVTTLNPKP